MKKPVYFFGILAISTLIIPSFVFAKYDKDEYEMLDEVASKKGDGDSEKKHSAGINTWIKQLNFLIKKRRVKEASVLALTKKILNTDPKNTIALNALGVFYLRSGKRQLAKIIFTRGLKADPKNSSIKGNLALISLKEGNKEEAMKGFSQSLRYRYENYASAANLGALYLEAYEYDYALEYLNLAYSRAKQRLSIANYEVLKTGNNYAIALAWSGDPKRAKHIFEELVENHPSSVEVLLNYAILLGRDLNRRKQALTYLRKADLMDRSRKRGSQIKKLRNYLNKSKKRASKQNFIYFAGLCYGEVNHV